VKWNYHIIGIGTTDSVVGLTKEARTALQMLGQIEMTLTEAGFARLEAGLSRLGLEIREVERVPYHEPVGRERWTK
jgi:hypothetical protein